MNHAKHINNTKKEYFTFYILNTLKFLLLYKTNKMLIIIVRQYFLQTQPLIIYYIFLFAILNITSIIKIVI